MTKKSESPRIPSAVEQTDLVDLDLDINNTAESTGQDRKTRGGSTNSITTTYWSATRCPTCYY
ncbi:MAG: hypothetical protein ACRD0P_16145 [Stackebrandtia sp.]